MKISYYFIRYIKASLLANLLTGKGVKQAKIPGLGVIRAVEGVIKADLHSANVSYPTLRWDPWACVALVVAQDRMLLLHSYDWKKSKTSLTFFSIAGE